MVGIFIVREFAAKAVQDFAGFAEAFLGEDFLVAGLAAKFAEAFLVFARVFDGLFGGFELGIKGCDQALGAREVGLGAGEGMLGLGCAQD